jgi:hypothetical protein
MTFDLTTFQKLSNLLLLKLFKIIMAVSKCGCFFPQAPVSTFRLNTYNLFNV